MKQFACNQQRGDGEKMTAKYSDYDYEWLKGHVNTKDYCGAKH